MQIAHILAGRHSRPFFVVAAAALCGFVAWGHGVPVLSTLAVPLWFLCTTRRQAWATMFAYYLAASRTIPFSSAVFFREGSSVTVGLTLWLASAALLALPWSALPLDTTRQRRLAALCFALLFSILPPIGLIGWTNPLLGAAQIVPGYGWLSLLTGVLLLASCADIAPTHPAHARRLGLAILICGLAAAWNMHRPLPTPPADWMGVQMHAGRAPEDAFEQGQRQAAVLEAIDTALAQGARVVILPEQILGIWSESWRIFLETTVGEEIRAKGAVIGFGAAVPTDDGEGTFNAFVTYDGQRWAQANARFAIPVSMWKPWRADSTQVEWFTSGIYTLAGQRILLSLCYEDLLVWPPLISFLSEPQMIVSIANAWWAGSGPAILDIQREHIEAWARIFDVPLIRALNAP